MRPVHQVHIQPTPDWGLWLKLRVMPDGRRVIYRDPRETYYENVPPPTSSATGSAPNDPPTADSPGPGEPEPEAEDLTVEETSSDVEVVSPKVMRKMEVMVPHYLLNFTTKIGLSMYVMEGFKFQENVMAVGLCNHPLEKIMVSAYVCTLGLGIFMIVNVRALVYVLTLGLSIFKDVYVLAPNVLTLGLRNYVIQYVATLGPRCCAVRPATFGLRDHLLGLLCYHLLG